MALNPLPHATRQQVFAALMTFLQNTVPPVTDPTNNKSYPWQQFSQLWKQWDQVPPAQQPALFLRRGPQEFLRKRAYGVERLQLRCSIWIYFRTDEFQVDPYYPDMLVDQFIDGLEQAFQVNLPNRLTLGKLSSGADIVFDCWIDGQVFSDPGLADNQAVIVAPISILL